MISYCLISTLFSPRVRVLRRGRSYIFGRDKAIDFPIPSDVVSRKHAELAWGPDGGFQVTDLGSKNGTRVNNVPVLAPHVLRDGEMVTIGPFSFQYREYRGDIATLMNEPATDLDSTAAIDGEAIAHIARVRAGLAPATPPAGFAGNFDGIELLEIARLVGAGERDGILTIQGEALSGQLGFLKGEIRRALAPGLSGEAAAVALLSLPHGRFEFTQGPMNLERNCRIRPDSLAMEVARRQDEQGKGEAPEAARPSAPAPVPVDPRAQAASGHPIDSEAAVPVGMAAADTDDEREPAVEQGAPAEDGLPVEPTERIPKLPPGVLPMPPEPPEPPKISQGETAELDRSDLERRIRDGQ